MDNQEVKNQSSMSGFVKPLLLVLVSLAIGAGLVYGLVRLKPEFLGLPKDSAQVQSEIDALVAEVSKLIALPTDEKPTVATVSDAEKVKEQPFFKNAKNGDKVLIYTNAKRAILYRQSENRIIEVGAVNINQASPVPSIAPTSSPQPAQ